MRTTIFILFTLCFTYANAATILVRNNCPYTVWAAGVPVGGGKRLERDQTWTINAPPGTKQARIWGRTGCNFDASGKGKCQTGDCNGIFFDISLVDGFNVPMEFSPTSNGCTRGITCKGDQINQQCPNELKTPGGCNNPCLVFKIDEYCCNSFFKKMCHDAYSYPKDDQTSTFTCPAGTNYKVVFCP
ncbi:unnamed protein product [Withania somnifera]